MLRRGNWKRKRQTNMAEPKPSIESDYIIEAQRIIREYLSGMGWVRAQRNILYKELKPAVEREDVEQNFKQLAEKEEDIEWKFGQEVDKWRKSDDPMRKIVLERIVQEVGRRNDLGFFGRRIVDRVKRELG